MCAVHGHVEVLAFDSRRYVGAQIGIHNPQGERVGTVSHVRNQEYVRHRRGPRTRCARLVDAAAGGGGRVPELRWPRRSTTATSARRRGSRRGSTRTTSAGSPSARSVTCRWSCGASTAPSRPPSTSRTCTTQLGRVAGEVLTVEHYVDDNMRNIPDHYHAHARPKGGFFGHGFRTADARLIALRRATGAGIARR